MNDARPVWLLDIDGVINAGTRKADRNVWPESAWIDKEVRGFPIIAAEPVLAYIRRAHQAGYVEIRWHTSWQHEAAAFAAEYGLPDFEIADAPEWVTWGDPGATWWKRGAAERVLRDERRPLVWTDDDIRWSLGRRGRDEMCAFGPALLISPSEYTGLTPKHLRSISDFLDLYPAPGAKEG